MNFVHHHLSYKTRNYVLKSSEGNRKVRRFYGWRLTCPCQYSEGIYGEQRYSCTHS